jgi:hypothetical protein
MIIQALARGFWMNRLLQSCRTGEPLALPPGFRTAKVRTLQSNNCLLSLILELTIILNRPNSGMGAF